MTRMLRHLLWCGLRSPNRYGAEERGINDRGRRERRMKSSSSKACVDKLERKTIFVTQCQPSNCVSTVYAALAVNVRPSELPLALTDVSVALPPPHVEA